VGHYTGAKGAASIALQQESEVHYWTRELRVDETRLRWAIAAVGTDEVDVRSYLATTGRARRTDERPETAATEDPLATCPA
jgi:hypothetical protein